MLRGSYSVALGVFIFLSVLSFRTQAAISICARLLGVSTNLLQQLQAASAGDPDKFRQLETTFFESLAETHIRVEQVEKVELGLSANTSKK